MGKKKRLWVCTDNKGNEHELTIGKVYEDIESGFADPFCIVIKNDLGILSEYYQPLRFVTLDDWRDAQLKSIGII